MLPVARTSAPVARTARAFFSPRAEAIRGLVEVVGAGAAAAEVGVGQLQQLDAGDGAQQVARFAADVLGLGEVAGVVVGDALRAAVAGGLSRAGRAREEDGHVHHPLAEGVRAGLVRRAAQDEVVFVHGGAAAGGVGDDGVHVCREGSRGCGARRRWAAAQSPECQARPPQQLWPAGMTTSTPLRASTSMVAVLMSGSSTCWAQPVSRATRARRSPRAGVTLGQVCAGGTRGGARSSIDCKARGTSGRMARPTPAALHGKPEARGIGDGLRRPASGAACRRRSA